MPRLTLAEFLGTYPAEREFVPSLGPSTTVGAFFDRLSAEEKALEVTYRGSEEGVFVFIDGLESARLGRVSWPTEKPTEPESVPAPTDAPNETAEPPTEPPVPSAGTIHIPAPYLWAMGYSAKLGAVETHYHAWQLAIDAQHRYRGTDEEKKAALRARAGELQRMYNAVRSDLYTWVVAHPAPEGTAELD